MGCFILKINVGSFILKINMKMCRLEAYTTGDIQLLIEDYAKTGTGVSQRSTALPITDKSFTKRSNLSGVRD